MLDPCKVRVQNVIYLTKSLFATYCLGAVDRSHPHSIDQPSLARQTTAPYLHVLRNLLYYYPVALKRIAQSCLFVGLSRMMAVLFGMVDPFKMCVGECHSANEPWF